MSKRKKVLLTAGLIVLAGVCFFALRSRNEPKYQDRYLSEWIEMYSTATLDRDSAKLEECELALQAIGTNALPYFLKGMRQEPPSIASKFPTWMPLRNRVRYWLEAGTRRADNITWAARDLGTNAVIAIPELQAMLHDRTRPVTAWRARVVLTAIGEPAIPILKAALDDPNYFARPGVADCISLIAAMGHTNTCIPILQEALHDKDQWVRESATSALRGMAPQLFTNLPPK